MLNNLAITLDLEDHRPASFPKRYDRITEDILSFMQDRNIRLTVFVLGRLAEESPELIKKISNAGHEIGYHSWHHIHIHKQSPKEFSQDLIKGKQFLEDLIGKAIIGYRAPAFSLTKNSLWAVDIIKEQGFEYSSSVLPASNPVNGFPGSPKTPYKWPNELIEIPVTVAELGPVILPYLGGIYLRYLPASLISCYLHKDEAKLKWLYCHVHDFDHEEAFYKIGGTSLLTSLLLFFNRKNTFKKLDKILQNKSFCYTKTLSDILKMDSHDQINVFNPDGKNRLS